MLGLQLHQNLLFLEQTNALPQKSDSPSFTKQDSREGNSYPSTETA